MRERPTCPTPVNPQDLGFDARTVRDLEDMALLAHAWRGGFAAANPKLASSALLRALARFAEGCRALEQGDPDGAVALLEEAATTAPGARLYPVAIALALLAAGREPEAAARWQEISGPWTRDSRHPAWAARFAQARGDSRDADDWLARAADGARSAGVVPAELAAAAAEHYFRLFDRERYADAERLALAMAERADDPAGARSEWLERAADCAVFANDLERAVRRYEQALEQTPDRASLLLKLSDLAHVRGELPAERRYREQVYGTLRPERR
jgi:tetratricopeptide (TPR) repeat protein